MINAMTARKFFEEILKKAKDNMWFETEDSEFFITICRKSQPTELIELAVKMMDGEEKEIFQHMLQSSLSAIEQLKAKHSDVD